MDPSHITDGVKSATTVRQTTTIETKVRGSNMNGSKTVVHLGIDLGKNFLPSVGRQRAGRAGAEEKGAPEWFVAGGSEYTAVPDWEAEACSGAHHWAREITHLGHEVQLMAPKFIKGNKNDGNDAEGISKRDDPYLRTLLIHGTRSVVLGTRTPSPLIPRPRRGEKSIGYACDLLRRFGVNLLTTSIHGDRRCPRVKTTWCGWTWR